MTKYAEIIERLENASGPDSEIDARIWANINGVKYAGHNEPYGDKTGRVQVQYTEPPKRKIQVTNNLRMPHAEPVTSSIDAAIALAKKMLSNVCCITTMGNDDGFACYCRFVIFPNGLGDEYGRIDARGWQQSLPFAILLALFRALERLEMQK